MKKLTVQRAIVSLSMIFGILFFLSYSLIPIQAAEEVYQLFDFTGADGADVSGMASNMKIKDNQLYYDGLGEKFNDFAGAYSTLAFSFEFKFSAFDTVNGNNFGFDFNVGNGADRSRVNLDMRSADNAVSNNLYFELAGGQSWSDNASRRLNIATPTYLLNTTYTVTIVFDKVMVGTTEKYILSGFINNVWFIEKEYTPTTMTNISGFAFFARNGGNIYFDNMKLASVPDIYPDGSQRRNVVGKLYSSYSFDGLNTAAMVPGFNEGNFRPTVSGEYTSIYSTLQNDSYNKYQINKDLPNSTNLNPTEGVFSVDAKIINRGTYNRFAMDFNFNNYAGGNEYRLNVNIHGNGNAYVDLAKLQTGQVANSWSDSANAITKNLKLNFDTFYTYKLYFEINAAGFYVMSVFIDDIFVLEYVTTTTSMGTANVQGFGLVVNKISDTAGDNTSDVTFDNLYVAALQDHYVDGSALRKNTLVKTYANYSFDSTDGTVPLFLDKEGSGFVLNNGKLKSGSTNEFNAVKLLSNLNQYAFAVDIQSIGDGTGGLRLGYDSATFYDLHFTFNAAGGSINVYNGALQYNNKDVTKGGKVFNPGLYPDTVYRIGVIVETLNATESNLTVFVNGVCVIEKVVAKLAPGRLGLTSNNSNIEFDNLTVTALGTDTYFDSTDLRVGGTPEVLSTIINFNGDTSGSKEFDRSDTIEFTAAVYQSDVAATYQWLLGLTEIEGAISSTLSLLAEDYIGDGSQIVRCVVNGTLTSNPLSFIVNYDPITSIALSSDLTELTAIQTAVLTAAPSPVLGIDPDAVYVWKVDGITVDDQNASTYSFTSDVAGSFEITAEVDGVISNIITIDVTYLPITELVLGSSKLDMTSIQTALLTITPNPALGIDPDTEYVWTVNDVVLNDVSGLLYSLINPTQGSYIISVAYNGIESNVITIDVTLGYYLDVTAIDLSVDHANITILESAEFTTALTPGTDTDPALFYVWKVEGDIVLGESTDTFTFSSLLPGIYHVTAQIGDLVSNEVTVVVSYVAVTEIELSTNHTALSVLESANLSAAPDPSLGLNPSLVYVWKVNGTVIPSLSVSAYVFTRTMPGNYVITAQIGDVISNEITIIVNYVELTDLVIVADTTDMTVVDTAQIDATPSPTTGINPALVYVWKINDVIVTGQGTDSLSFSTMTPGTYHIVASIGDLVSNEVTIVIDYLPLTAVTVTVDKTSVAQNEVATYTAMLTPNAGTNPELIYYWFVNDTLVEDVHTSVFTWTTSKGGDYTVKCQVGIITSPLVTVSVQQGFRFDIAGIVSGSAAVLIGGIFLVLKRFKKF